MLFSSLYYHYFPLIYSYNLVWGEGGVLWPWSYGSWIYNYLWNQCLSSLILWVGISIRARSTTLCDSLSVTCGRSVVFSGSFGFPHDISSHVLVLEVSILHLSTMFLLVCEAVPTVWACVGFFSFFVHFMLLFFLFEYYVVHLSQLAWPLENWK
jgi:hypothetical protein